MAAEPRGRVAARGALLASLLALTAFPSTSAAQGPRAPVLAGYDGGFVLRSADGANSLRLMGLVQLQLAHDRPAGSAPTDRVFVNRARVGLVGSIFRRDLRYMLVVELGGADVQLLFATLDYTVVADWLTVRVGRFKLPFSRSFITMASQLSLIDRPLTVGPSAFGDAVDVGVALHNGTTGPFEYSVGVFGGTGAEARADRLDPLLSVRVGYNRGDLDGYSESDLDGGPLRYGVAAAALVDFDADGDHASFTSALLDVMLKAHGFSLSSAFYVGARQSGQRWSAQRASALGHHTQLSYVIAQRLEPVLRYAVVMPLGAGDARHDVAGGLNVYLHGHALKLQAFASARFADRTRAPDVRLQGQLSVAL